MAKKAKPQAKTNKPKSKPVKKAPAEYVFWCHDGSIFRDIVELAAGLEAMSDETFAYHSNAEKHDFSNWLRDVIGDEKLAEELEKAIDRPQAIRCVIASLN